jgi:hypothetical protein
MSYKLNVLAGNPYAYYPLNGNFIDGINATSSISSTNYSFISPPIITNSGSALKISSNTTASLANNSIEALCKNFEDKTFTVAFWFSLNNQLTGSGYGSNPVDNSTNKLNLFHVNSTTPKIFTIYYDYISNTIRLKVLGNGNTEAYVPIRDMSIPYYVVATYSNKSLSISVNGDIGVSGYVNDTSTISAYDKTSIYYSLGNSLVAGKQVSHYLISDLAIYDRTLDIKEINSHISWAFNDGKPMSYSSNSSDISFVNMQASENSFHYAKVISGKNFQDQGIYYNLNIDNFGISPQRLDRSASIAYSGSPVIVSSSSNGISWSGSAGVQLNNIYPQFDLSKFMINLQLKRTSVQNENIFSISTLSDSSYIYMTSSSTSYALNYFNPTDSSSLVIISSASAPKTGSANIAVVFDSDRIFMYTSDAGSAVYYTASNNSLQNLRFSNYTNIIIGNYIQSVSTFSSSVKNIGISEKITYDFSSFNWSRPLTLMTKFINTEDLYIVSQYGYWQTVIPVTSNNNSFISQIDWNTMDNCTVSTSIDSSSTFNVISKNSPIYNYNSLSISKPSTLMVELYTDYYVEDRTQSFNNLSISIADSIGIKTDVSYYEIIPIVSSSATSPSFKNDSVPIISNPSNFGIKFSGSNGNKPAYLYASTQFSTYYGVDFWFRNDRLSGSAIVFSGKNGPGSEPFVYISNSGYLTHNASALYINGASVSSGSFSISTGVPYHIAIVPTASLAVSSSSFYINGYPTTASINTSCATYGMMNIWEVSPTSSSISSVYNSYLGRNTQSVIDDNVTKVVSNISSDLVFAYKNG